MRPALHSLRNLFSCRLCWHITLVVFGLILAVESVILIPSAARFKNTEIKRLAYAAQITVEPVLMLGRGVDANGLLTRDLAPLVSMYGISEIALYRPSGELLTAVGAEPPPGFPGKSADLGRIAAKVASAEDGSRLEVAWHSDAPGSPVAVVRIDSSKVSRDLAAYLLRIGGLVALIVLVVTVGTMLVLHRWVLRPLLQLRDSALAAGVEPGRANAFIVTATRRDEVGELIAAHNAMLERVADSKRRDHEVAEERTRFLTRHDPLTRLPNRAALIEHVDGLARLRIDASCRIPAQDGFDIGWRRRDCRGRGAVTLESRHAWHGAAGCVLSYLRRFAVDAIKIDKSFVDDIGADANAEAVCDAILRLGKSLNTKIVAEGVENSLQLEFLRARRCDEVQGYFFSKPLPLAAFEKDWIAVRAVA